MEKEKEWQMQMCGLSEKTSSNHQDHLPKQYLQIKTYLLCWSAPRLSLGRNRMSKLEKREEEWRMQMCGLTQTEEGHSISGETQSAVIEVTLTNKPQPTRPLLPYKRLQIQTHQVQIPGLISNWGERADTSPNQETKTTFPIQINTCNSIDTFFVGALKVQALG